MDEANNGYGIEFFIPGKPQGKARARTFYNPRLKRVQTITPDNTVLYENLIKMRFLEAVDSPLPLFDAGIPVRLELTIMYGVPRSASKKASAEMLLGAVRPCKKPDADNVIKCVADALNGVAYKDDTQVCEVAARKLYSTIEGVRVHISRLA